MKRRLARGETGQGPLSKRSKSALQDFCASICDKSEVAVLLRVFANAKRLLILHELLVTDELSASQLAETVGVRQASLSQHLTKLRKANLLCSRRDKQRIYYRVSDDAAIQRMLRGVDHLLR